MAAAAPRVRRKSAMLLRSSDWFHDREKAISSVLRSLEQALQYSEEFSVPAGSRQASTTTDLPKAESIDLKASDTAKHESTSPRFTRAETYKKYQHNGYRNRNYLMRSEYLYELAKQIRAIVQCEGPIHEELLTERLKEINGVARAGTIIQNNVERAINSVIRNHGLERKGGFIKVRGYTCGNFRVPGDEVLRPLSQIPPEEIEIAVLYIVEDQFGYQREALPRAICELFGFERTPTGTSDIVGSIVDVLIERGKLRLSGPNVYIA